MSEPLGDYAAERFASAKRAVEYALEGWGMQTLLEALHQIVKERSHGEDYMVTLTVDIQDTLVHYKTRYGNE